MISLDRVINYARSQGFRVHKVLNSDGTHNIVIKDKRGNETTILENHVEGTGVSKYLEDMIRWETQP